MASGTAVSSTVAAENSSELWSIPLEYTDGTSLKIADTDGDGADEVAIASKDSFGPSNYGIAKEGEWLWEENSAASVQADTSGDVNGDGEPEVIFKAKVFPVWVRPYTHEGDLLWSGDLGGWVDDTAPIDYDDDGNAEVAAQSTNQGYFRLFDDDGSVEWDVRSGELIERLRDFRDVTDTPVPEILTHIGESGSNEKEGLQLVKQDGDTGVERVWEYGPVEPVKPTFTDLDGDGSLEVLAAYPERGEVRGIDTDGSELWTESVDVSSGRATTLDVDGDGTSDAVIWSDTSVVILDGATRDTSSFSTESPVQRVAEFTDGKILIATEDHVVTASPDSGVEESRSISRDVQDLAAGDVNGDGVTEVVIGFADEVIATADLSSEEVDGEQKEISVDKAEVVQVVGRSERNDSVVEPISTVIENRRSSVVFSLSSSEELTEDIGDIPVKMEFEDLDEDSLVSEGTPPYEFNIPAEEVTQISNTLRYPVESERSPGNYPVFKLESNFSVTVIVGDGDSDVLTKEFSFELPDNATIQNSDNTPRLRVGFAPIIDVGNSTYGQFDAEEYDDIVDSALRFLRQEFPTTEVIAFQYGRSDPQDDAVSAEGDPVSEAWITRNILDNELPVSHTTSNGDLKRQSSPSGSPEIVSSDEQIDDFDVTVGIVPFNYVKTTTGETADGVHYRASQDQPRVSALAEVGFSGVLVAHEICHHFIGKSYTNGVHAPDDIITDSYDFKYNEFSANPNTNSFMTEGIDNNHQMDTIAFNHMTDDDFEPTPREGISVTATARLILGGVDDYVVRRITKTATGLINKVSDKTEETIAEVVDSDGDPLAESVLATDIEPTFDQGDNSESESIIEGHVEFPENTYEINIVDEGEQVNSFFPTSRLLFDAVGLLPNNAFRQNPQQRRRAIKKKLDTVERQLDQKAFDGAAEKLATDVRGKFERWLKEDYDTTAEEYTKEELLDLTDEVVNRVRTLASESQ